MKRINKPVRYFLITLVTFLLIGQAQGQMREGPDLKSRVQKQHELAQLSGNWVEGYARKIGGEDITYNSVRDDCSEALITRATDGKMTIEWETAVVPADYSGRETTFFLLAGLSKSTQPRTFRVYIDDVHRFDYVSTMDLDWQIEGKNGGSMAFSNMYVDPYNDAYGYLRITVPSDWVGKGRPARMKIVGKAEQDFTWLMIFKCPDAFDYFLESADIERWFDVNIAPAGRNKSSIEIEAPYFLAGKGIQILADEEFVGEGILADEGNLSRIAFDLKKPVETFTGQSFEVRVDGRSAFRHPSLFVQSEATQLKGKSIVLMTTESEDAPGLGMHVEVLYQPKLTTNLMSISKSTLGSGEIHIINSSHQDIAWMDSPQQCIEDRDVLLVTPALEQLKAHPDYGHDLENALILREYLDRHPDRKEEIYQLSKQGRITWGAAYNAPYEEMYCGEALIRQFYLGKRWIEELFPGVEATTYWNVDVPGRTLQMPQILAKSGVKYMVISRHERGVFRWESPDGSSIPTYSSAHYGRSRTYLRRGFIPSAVHISQLAEEWKDYNTNSASVSVIPVISSEDMSPPIMYYDLIDNWNNINVIETESGEKVELALPEMKHSTAEQFIGEMVASTPDIKTIRGERPAVWLYIHGPSHHRALTAAREAGMYLPAAEKFATMNALLAGTFRDYPQQALTRAWEAAIYPDHGWGGKNGDITDQLFLDRMTFGRDQGKEILQHAVAGIAGKIDIDKSAGIPIHVFNSLSWQRTDPVHFELEFTQGEAWSVSVKDHQGNESDVQVVEFVNHPDGSIKKVRGIFIASGVPSIGYKTYYVELSDEPFAMQYPDDDPVPAVENSYYRISLGPGGIAELYDKELDKSIIDSKKFLGGELFTMQSNGNGAGEFADIQQPSMEGFEKLSDYNPVWRKVEEGPVRTVVRMEEDITHTGVRQELVIYHTIKRIDVNASLIGWDGTLYREYRLAFPINQEDSEVSYEVPMGVVTVGEDEIEGAAGERYQTPCTDIHPRGIMNWIGANGSGFGVTLSSSVAVADYIDPTENPVKKTILQPILLASRHSCHWEGLPYRQQGDHHFNFSFTSHETGWKHGYRFGRQANEPLIAVTKPVEGAPQLPQVYSFLNTENSNVIISTIKKCEDDDEVIVRLFDMEGRDGEVRVNIFREIKEAAATDLIERVQPGTAMSFDENKLSLSLGHHSIETVKLNLKK